MVLRAYWHSHRIWTRWWHLVQWRPCYGTYALFAMTDAQVKEIWRWSCIICMSFYFESAAMILTLITVGKMLEARSKGKTTDALKGLMKLAPKTAVIERKGRGSDSTDRTGEKGDIFIVRPGESIPVDGKILEGHSAVNEAALTGESIPVDKEEGEPGIGSHIESVRFIRCEATCWGRYHIVSDHSDGQRCG